MNIRINGKEVYCTGDETLIEIARREGCEIPSLCYAKDARHKSSCMLCSVRNSVSGQIIPACSTQPFEGMQIETGGEEVETVRTLSLELLLSDHRADCEAPCKTACPAGFDVARMNRLHDSGKTGEALEFMRDSLVIPATLCFICNAPCERICRKKDLTEAVAIREIKKSLVAQTRIDRIVRPASNGIKTAVIGSNPAGLAAAYRLRKRGFDVTVFEKESEALTPHIEPDKTPAGIIGLEIEVLKRTGVDIITSSDRQTFDDYDGIVSVSGDTVHLRAAVLAAKTKQPARLVFEGFKLADRLSAMITGENTVEMSENKRFNSTYSRFSEKEKGALSVQSLRDNRPSGCLYCDCDRNTDCRLRDYAAMYGIKNSRYSRETSLQAMNRQQAGSGIRFEPAKCIRCGLCVYNSDNGFTFINRGFDMQIVLPEENACNIDAKLPGLCPTGALYRAD